MSSNLFSLLKKVPWSEVITKGPVLAEAATGLYDSVRARFGGAREAHRAILVQKPEARDRRTERDRSAIHHRLEDLFPGDGVRNGRRDLHQAIAALERRLPTCL